jgi:hypothetical protein
MFSTSTVDSGPGRLTALTEVTGIPGPEAVEGRTTPVSGGLRTQLHRTR